MYDVPHAKCLQVPGPHTGGSFPETDDQSAARRHWINRTDKNVPDAQSRVVFTWLYL